MSLKNVPVEYVWLDGSVPTKKLRSKKKIIPLLPKYDAEELRDSQGQKKMLAALPIWSFDGSSTNQAEGKFSDVILKPVRVIVDPNHIPSYGAGASECAYVVLCETYQPPTLLPGDTIFDYVKYGKTGKPHPTNTRAILHDTYHQVHQQEPLFGVEQEYVFLDPKTQMPLGFPEGGYPAPQGPYYCGNGANKVFGREIFEGHLRACLDAGLQVSGTNVEVMPGQFEFQIGPGDPLLVADHLWLARFLLLREAEKHGVLVTFCPKPVKGDWNGSGCHTNFSTKEMREEGGMVKIVEACEKLAKRVPEHLAVYGNGYQERLTGVHETCRYDEFKWGVADRSCSIRIPIQVSLDGQGYFEDRRPNANADPNETLNVLLETICLGK